MQDQLLLDFHLIWVIQLVEEFLPLVVVVVPAVGFHHIVLIVFVIILVLVQLDKNIVNLQMP